MLLFRVALLTCAFYLAICALIDLVIFLLMRFGKLGVIGIRGWSGFLAVFGSIWLMSLYCSVRIFMANLRAQMPH